MCFLLHVDGDEYVRYFRGLKKTKNKEMRSNNLSESMATTCFLANFEHVRTFRNQLLISNLHDGIDMILFINGYNSLFLFSFSLLAGGRFFQLYFYLFADSLGFQKPLWLLYWQYFRPQSLPCSHRVPDVLLRY